MGKDEEEKEFILRRLILQCYNYRNSDGRGTGERRCGAGKGQIMNNLHRYPVQWGSAEEEKDGVILLLVIL